MTKIDYLKVKMFADGADLESIKELSKKSYIQGFTTNPSLMKKGGIVDYKKFVIDMLNIVKDKPVSFEVFSDEINEMENQAREIASWGKNIYVKNIHKKGQRRCKATQNINKKNKPKEKKNKAIGKSIELVYSINKKKLDNISKKNNKIFSCSFMKALKKNNIEKKKVIKQKKLEQGVPNK